MSTGQIGTPAAITMHLATMVYVGFYFNKKGGGDSANGFYLRDRKLGALIVAMNAEALNMSSQLLMGLPGVAYLTGIADAGWTTTGLAVGTCLNWLIVARRLHRYSVVCGATTILDFFSRRYRDDRSVLIRTATIVILIFFIPYTASDSKAVGALFNNLFGVNYHMTVIAGAVVITGYIVSGEFMVVSTTDLIRSIVMSIAPVVVVFFDIHVAGDWNVVADNARSLVGYLNMTHIHNMADNTVSPYDIIAILSTIAWGLGYFGMPHILLRFMAINHEDKLKTSRRIAPVWVAISIFVAILIDIIGNGTSVTRRVPMFSSSLEPETVIIRLADLLGHHGILLSTVTGVVLVGILARTMSMVNSRLLTAMLGVPQDLLQDFLKIKMNTKVPMTTTYTIVASIALVVIPLAWNPDSSVFTIVSPIWVDSGVSFGLVMLFALFWKCNNLKGALVGMISGGVMVFAWKHGVRSLGDTWNTYELLPAFITAYITIVTVSLMAEAPSVEICDEYDSMGK